MARSAPAAQAQANVPSLRNWLAGQLSLAAGFDSSRGDYGQETDTEVLYVPFTVRYLFDEFVPAASWHDHLELGLSVPYVEVDGPFETGARDGSRERGIGDIQLGVTPRSLGRGLPIRGHRPIGWNPELRAGNPDAALDPESTRGTGSVDSPRALAADRAARTDSQQAGLTA